MANFPASTVSGEYLARVVGVEAANQRYLIDRMRRLPGLANGLTSVLKRNAYMNGKILKPLEEAAKKATKSINIFDKLFKKVPGGGDNAAKAVKMSPILGLLLTLGLYILSTFNTKLIEQRQKEQDRINDRLNFDSSKILTTLDTVNNRVKQTNESVRKLDERLIKTDKEAYSASKNATAAREKANDALYEVRQGRKILDGQITEAKKDSNDALYEVRKGREKLQDQIDKINKDLSKYLTGVKDNFQERIDTTLKGIVKSLDKNTDKIVEHNKAISTLQDTLKVVDKIVKGLPKTIPTTKDLEDFALKLINTKIQPIEKDAKKALTTAEDAQKNGVTKKEYDGTITSLRTTYDKSFEAVGAKWNEQFRAAQGKIGEITKVVTSSDFVSSDSKITKDIATLTKTVEKNKTDLEKKAAQDKSDLEKKINDTKATLGTLGTLDKKINDTRSDLEKKIGGVPTIDPAEIDKIKRDNDQNKKDVKDLIPRIKEVEEGIKEQEKVNQSAIPKLEEILRGLPLIPGKAADAIKPSIPTKDDIKQATGQAICSSLNGGCSGKANQDLANNINNNTNNRAGDVLGAVNAAENTAQLEILNTINTKLGAQVPNGISGKLSRIGEWLHLDRALNILIWMTTIHNAAMLSSDLGQTLLGILSNGLQLIGLKKEDGSAFDLNSIINSTVENIVIGAIGQENYTELSQAWAKAVRVYQASANLLNSVTNIGNTILNGTEILGGMTGKIGNALKGAKLVADKAYEHFNPQPNYHSKIFTWLETAQQGANTVQQITQIPLDIAQQAVDVGTQAVELQKSLKDDDASAKGQAVPKAENEEAKALAQKLASVTAGFDIFDGFNAND